MRKLKKISIVTFGTGRHQCFNRFHGYRFNIDNSDNFDWKDVEVEINSGIIFGGFKLNVPVIRAHKKYSVGALEFVKSDGTRFNPILTKLLHISISCETPSGYGWWDDTF
jgi:hypothetical protein